MRRRHGAIRIAQHEGVVRELCVRGSKICSTEALRRALARTNPPSVIATMAVAMWVATPLARRASLKWSVALVTHERHLQLSPDAEIRHCSPHTGIRADWARIDAVGRVEDLRCRVEQVAASPEGGAAAVENRNAEFAIRAAPNSRSGFRRGRCCVGNDATVN